MRSSIKKMMKSFYTSLYKVWWIILVTGIRENRSNVLVEEGFFPSIGVVVALR